MEDNIQNIIHTIKRYKFNNNALKAYQNQIVNHLEHVNFTFNIQESKKPYPHALIYQDIPKHMKKLAIDKANLFLQIVNNQFVPKVIAYKPSKTLEEYEQEEKYIVRNIIQKPLQSYLDMSKIIENDIQASFMNLSALTNKLFIKLQSIEIIQLCRQYNWLDNFRFHILDSLQNILQANIFPYRKTIEAIEYCLEFLDIYHRLQEQPELYHSHRYEYYKEFLLSSQESIMFPTSCALSPSDLLDIRCVPIFFVGCNTDIERVDGFKQTPYEFFHHDVNHSRRMLQFSQEAAQTKNLSLKEYTKDCTKTYNKSIKPLLDKNKYITNHQKDIYKALRMILFEILHEDALPVDREIIAQALFRPALELTPFEHIDKDRKNVYYIMEPGATTLAYTFRKLFHTFYDIPENRYKSLGDESVRSRKLILEAALYIWEKIKQNTKNIEKVRQEFIQLITTDEGFPEDFFKGVLEDINQRNDHTFNFLVSKPVSSSQAIEQIIKRDKDVNVIFGYSALEYQDDDELQKQLEMYLSKLDNSKVIISTGATDIGIGITHQIASKMGFETLGIISNISLLGNYSYSKYIDNFFIIKDNCWGGYITKDILSPVSYTFLSVAKQVQTFGGGKITADCVDYALKNKIPVQTKYLAPKY